jgi:hypothetical protein
MEKVVIEKLLPQTGLDAITVFWQDFERGHGAVTILCYDSAWTTYFGGLGERKVRDLFRSADVSYLVNRFVSSQWLKQTKSHERYLTKIVEAVQLCTKEAA